MFSSVTQMDDRQVVSVVITSMPILKSALIEATPGPTNSITLLFTYPFLNTAPMMASATS